MILYFSSSICSFHFCPVCDRRARVDKFEPSVWVFRKGDEEAHAADKLIETEEKAEVSDGRTDSV
jgi:hypothetical protein